MWRQVRRGRWQNADASNRAERPILYIVGGVALVALLAYLLLLRPQSFMVRGVVATLGMMAVCAARDAMDQSVAAHGVRHAGRRPRWRSCDRRSATCCCWRCRRLCGRVSRCSGTRRSKWRSARSSAPARALRFIICDCRARAHSSRERCGRAGVPRGRRAKPRASPSVGRRRRARRRRFAITFRKQRGSALRGVLHLARTSRARWSASSTSAKSFTARFEARTSGTTRSCPTPGAA